MGEKTISNPEEKPHRSNDEWKRIALEEGEKGKSYWWSDADRKHIRSTEYVLQDGTKIGIPEEGSYPVEITYPDGSHEYPKPEGMQY